MNFLLTPTFWRDPSHSLPPLLPQWCSAGERQRPGHDHSRSTRWRPNHGRPPRHFRESPSLFTSTPAMAAAVPGTAKAAARPEPARRLPLTPSEKGNAIRLPRAAREVPSRYLSSVSSFSSSSSSSSAATPPRRCPSPMVARPSPDLPSQKRAQSAERRRHSGSGPASDSPAPKIPRASTATTTRSLSVSFQGESFSLPVKKPAPTPTPSPAAERRRASPVRGKPGEGQSPRNSENSRLLLEHQHRWPARLRSSSLLTRSLDHSAAEKIGALATPIRPDSSADASTSDTESVSSGSNSESTTGIVSRSVARGLLVPARFWQETNCRLRRLHCSLPSPAKKAFPDSPRRQPSPLKASPRPASPSRLSTSSPRGSQSPSRPRPPASGGNAPSLLSFAAEVRRGKMGETRVEQAHALRLLHNRHLQWRFANARVNAALAIQCQNAERHLYTSWLATSELRELVARKRIQLQSQRLNLKLTSILLGQISYLENWSLIESDSSDSLTELIQDLRASTLQLPVTEGAQADMLKVKDAISSAVDVMQAMGSPISSLLAKVRGTNFLATKLAKISEQEWVLLANCKGTLSSISAMQVQEASLRADLSQLRHSPYLTQL